MLVEIVKGSAHTIGKVTTKKGYVYACTYGESDREINEETIKADWKEDRQSFRPFNESTGLYL